MVHGNRVRHVAQAEAGGAEAGTEVDVLHVHEEALVEAVDGLERRAAHEHAGGPAPGHVVRRRVTAQRAAQEGALERGGAVERVAERRREDDVAGLRPRRRQRSVDGGLQGAVGVDEPREDAAERGLGVERAEQRGERARGELAVAVEHQYRASCARRRARVAGPAEADVVAALDQARAWKLLGDHRLRAVGRAVVDDDGLHAQALGGILERGQTAREVLARVPGDDDGGDVHSYWGPRHGPQTPIARTRPGGAVARLGVGHRMCHRGRLGASASS